MVRGERGHGIEQQSIFLTTEEDEAIGMRADIRRRDQFLRIEMIAIKQPWANEAMRQAEERARGMVTNEAKGASIPTDKDNEELLSDADSLERKAFDVARLFPVLAAYHLATAAKLRLSAGGEAGGGIEETKAMLENRKGFNTAAANLLPDAILLGIQRRLLENKKLPSKEKVAEATKDLLTLSQEPSQDRLATIAAGKKMLSDYALVLPEQERPDFLALIPDEYRREVAIILDESLAKVLHQSIIEKGADEDKQRKDVRLRVFGEMRQALSDGKRTDKKIAARLARAMGRLGGDARLLLLELARDEMEAKGDKEQDYLPYVMGVLMKEFDDWRVNDVALQLVGDADTPPPVARSLLHKLIKRDYIPKNVGEWWENKDVSLKTSKKYSENNKLREDHQKRLLLLRKVITDLGVVPSRDILEFLDDDQRWKKGILRGALSLDERVDAIRSSQTEFAKAASQQELVKMLSQDEHKAMIYYLLHGGDDRFNLINNYSFERFKEMLKMIADLRVHEQPLSVFKNSLLKGGIAEAEAGNIIKMLRAGRFPLDRPGQDVQEASFEVSENAAVKNANAEVGRVLGREQLGVVLLFPLYREYLEKDKDKTLISKMQAANTFAERLRVIGEIELNYPDFQNRAKADLEQNWRALGEKMVLEMTLEQVFTSPSIAIRGEELIPKLNTKRIDLKRMKKDLLVALRGGNEKLKKINEDLYKKRKARGGLLKGLDKVDVDKRAKLQSQIDALDQEISDLETQKAAVNDAKVDQRFAELNPKEREAEIERIGKEIIALTEKSPSAIFTYLTMQVLGEERLREQDVALVQEMESHLQGPFQTVSDYLTYQPTGKERIEKKNQRVSMRYVDKVDRLMNMVRFADSKICCFSSSNYEMVVQHGMPNKYWVASINADPLSFVLSIEIPQGALEENQRVKSVENLGFIFGNFSIDKDGQLGIMLNGIYYAPGIEDSRQVEAMMEAIRRMFNGLPIKSEAIASQHGGSIKMPEGFSNEPVELTRLRALDAGDGSPETKIYDDIGTGDRLNSPNVYNAGGQGNLWHN